MAMQRKDDRPPEPVHGAKFAPQHPSGGVGMKQIILIGLCAVIISIVVISTFFLNGYVKKADDTKNLQSIVDSITTARADLSKSLSDLQAIVNALPDANAINRQIDSSVSSATSTMSGQISSMQNQVNDLASKVNNMASKIDIDDIEGKVGVLDTELNALKGQLNTINSSITSLKAELKTAQDAITALTARIKVLEVALPTPTPTATIPSSVVIAEIKYMSNVLIIDATDNTSKTLIGSVRLKLTNTSSSDVEDIMLDLIVEFDGVPYHPQASLSGGTTWKLVGSEYSTTYLYTAEFISSSWGMKIPANSSKTLYIDIKLTTTGSIAYKASDYFGFYVSVAVE